MPTFRKQGEVSEKAAGRKLEILNIYFFTFVLLDNQHFKKWIINP